MTKGILIGIILGVVVLGVIVFFFLPRKPLSETKPPPIPSLSTIPPTAKPASKQIDLESCNFNPEENPLIQGKIEKFTAPDAAEEKQEVIVGRFYGILHTFNLKPNKDEADIQLISPTGDQILPFSLKEEKGVIEDAQTLKPMAITKLKKGFTIQMSFNCFPNMTYGERFKITKFAVTGKF